MKAQPAGFSIFVLAVLVTFNTVVDVCSYVFDQEVHIRHSGFEPAIAHPFALWSNFILDGVGLAIVAIVIVVYLIRKWRETPSLTLPHDAG